MDFLKELEGLGTELVNLAKIGIDSAKVVVPEVAREALIYWTTMTVFEIIIVITILTICTIIAVRCGKSAIDIQRYSLETDPKRREMLHDQYFDDANQVYWVFAILLGLVSLIMSIILIVHSAPMLIKAFTAPNLFFLEKVTSLFK